MVTEKTFIDWLVNAQPLFDEMILKDIKPTDSWIAPFPQILPLDIRLLPVSHRRVFNLSWFHHKSGLHISKLLKLNYRKVLKLKKEANSMIEPRLIKWIDSLPPRRKIIENRRFRGLHLGMFPTAKKFTTDEFHDVSSQW